MFNIRSDNMRFFVWRCLFEISDSPMHHCMISLKWKHLVGLVLLTKMYLIIFLLHEPEGCIKIASRGLICIVLKIPRAKPEGFSTMHINPRDAISMHPKGSWSRDIVTWFTIQTRNYLTKWWISTVKLHKMNKFSVKSLEKQCKNCKIIKNFVKLMILGVH